MGNIGSQLGEALGSGITNAISAYQQVQELNRRRREEDARSAEKRLGLLRGEAQSSFLNRDYGAVAASIPGMNEQRKVLGLPELPAMNPTPIKMPDLAAVGPFDQQRGYPRPTKQVGEQWTDAQIGKLRGAAGVTPHYVNASGDIWDETTGQYITTLPMTGARERIASQEAISANRQAAADARAAEANNIRMFLGGLQHIDREAARRDQGNRFQQGQGNLGGRMKWLAPDGKTYWVGVSKEGKYIPLPGPDGKPMQAPPDAATAGGGLLDDGPDAPPAAPAPSLWERVFGSSAGGQALKPMPSSAPPASAPPNVKPLPGATPRANTAFGAASAAAPGLVVTSVKRSPEKNKAANGVPNSYHLTGDAVDMVGPKGQPPTREQFIKVRDAVAPYGYEALLHDKGSGLHIHIEPGPGGRKPQPKATAKPIKPQAAGPRADLKAQRKAGQDLADLILSEMGE